MSMNKMAMSDDMLDQVTGGTVLPHIIKSGESIETIASDFHVDPKLLRKWNNLSDKEVLSVGDKLNIYY